ncbi:MAG TPA: tetratricopeptide repeat protein [Candidatus Binataceae bacterium]|nr:tetratricopeptide repeat protein [Candidatus Binataceae bacterium]
MRFEVPCGRLLALVGAVLFLTLAATSARALEEQSIPAADLTLTPSPSPSASPAAEGASPGASPTFETGAPPPLTPTATYTTPPSPDIFPEPTPVPTATGDETNSGEIGSVTPQANISDRPLDAEIAAQTDPARAASMRVVEQARQELQAGKSDEAVRTLQRAMSIDSSDPYAYFYLGRADLKSRQYEQAMAFFKHAEIGLGSNPEWLGETLAYEGLTYELSEHLVAAQAAYQQALQAAPGNLMAQVGYTRVSANIAPSETPTVGEAPAAAPPPYPPAEPPPPTAPPGPSPEID